MRMPSDLPNRRRRDRPPRQHRGRIVVIVVVALVAILFLSARWIASFFTDYLWFDSLGYSSVFSKVVWTRIGLVLAFTGFFFVFCIGNLIVADRVAPPFRMPGPEEEFLERYHQLMAGRIAWARAGVSL